MKISDSNGGLNHIVPVSSGLLKPQHIKQIGQALALFLKFEDMVTTGKGADGLVLGGRPVSDEHLAELLGPHEKTIGKHRRRLKAKGYIDWKRTPIGYAITVKKSKKWAWIQNRTRSRNATSQGKNAPVMERNGSALETFRLPGRAKTLHPDQTEAGQKQDEGATATENCWKAIGEKLPLGTRAFQKIWEFLFTHKNGEPISEAMERAILRAQSNKTAVPRPFYEAKRRIEAEEAKNSPSPGSTERPPNELSKDGKQRLKEYGLVQ